ncbi:MAG: hypothetical protein WAM95_16970 [Bacillus sp. (in: firmicutes)]
MFSKSKYMMLIGFVLVVLSACSPNKTERTIEEKNPELEVSSTFSIPVTFEEGKDGEYILVGEKGKLAFQIGSGLENETIELSPIRAKQPNKYMWYLWGADLGNKPFKVIGTNADTEEDLVVVEDRVLGAKFNGADAHTPSLMEFPTAGLWKLDAYIDEELFGSIVVEIK